MTPRIAVLFLLGLTACSEGSSLSCNEYEDEAVLRALVQSEPSLSSYEYLEQVKAWAKNVVIDSCQRDSYIKWVEAAERNLLNPPRTEEDKKDQIVKEMLDSGQIVRPPPYMNHDVASCASCSSNKCIVCGSNIIGGTTSMTMVPSK